ncbi:hypothetical protein KZX46_04355 [Polymorphobacter sp. PAMC 29334]|uniref:hypothetical protein n=1 Tax=Polymorphobacter sp. PAMC 29334 TaxID=2862331 RepID=UPI001C76612C|nr:hypothetical protein [Polymorphobacter sp. PAMC 29334]QYE35239.1 hypothetical protein KZX46_04355 [Polymorphobacter sp. PAMC 29334]
MSAVQHEPWVGLNYGSGAFNGEKIAIVGYSHWDNDIDTNEKTKETLAGVATGSTVEIAFFNKIMGYFKRDDPAFWNEVMFFNFIPNTIGTGDERHDSGTDEQHRLGQARALALMEEHKPDRVFVFSAKAWRNFPKSIEDLAELQADEIIPEEAEFVRNHYRVEDHVVLAFGLRHPQGAADAIMYPAVAAALRMTSSPPRT